MLRWKMDKQKLDLGILDGGGILVLFNSYFIFILER